LLNGSLARLATCNWVRCFCSVVAGVMVEVYNDVALLRCPITRSEVQAMIAEVKGARLLQGFRGRLAANLEAPP
jgi:acetate---CoA ligase (ADP-forming)